MSLVKTYSQSNDELEHPGSSTRPVTSDTRESEAERQWRLDREDEKVVDDEIETYERMGVTPIERQVDLILYWEHNAKTLPCMYRVALDILPVQASSVACKRVFSSSKETNTLHRSNLSPALMEVLQMLKYSVRQELERLSFTDSWLPSESDLAALEVSQEEVDKLFAEGRFDEVFKLLNEAEQCIDSEK